MKPKIKPFHKLLELNKAGRKHWESLDKSELQHSVQSLNHGTGPGLNREPGTELRLRFRARSWLWDVLFWAVLGLLWFVVIQSMEEIMR